MTSIRSKNVNQFEVGGHAILLTKEQFARLWSKKSIRVKTKPLPYMVGDTLCAALDNDPENDSYHDIIYVADVKSPTRIILTNCPCIEEHQPINEY
jgi:hypothetical protein